MTKTRAAAVLAVLAMAFSATGCTTAADDPGASPTKADDERSPSSSEKRNDAAFPSQPAVEIDWQNTVVDIVPTSRFQDPPGGEDTANIETVLALAEDPDDDTRKFLEDLEGVSTEFDGKLVRLSYSIAVEAVEEDRYEFEISAPVEFAELSKNDDLSIVVLLPRNAEEYEDVPNYDVRLEGFTEGTPEDDLEILQAEEAPSRRITVGLYERTDPKIGILYNFLPLG